MDKALRHERILDCRYYNGEEEAPSGIDSSFWFYEQLWANNLNYNWEYEEKDLARLGIANFDPEDGTPYELKCLLFNRYCHWLGLHGDTEAFLSWYREQYQRPRMTNRQRRAEKRKAELIKRCRYYKGEEDCPYIEAKEEHFWKYEKIWVEKLSDSFSNAENWRKELLPYKNLQVLVKEHGLPSSYIGLLINRDKHWLGIFDEQCFIKSIEYDYLKIK